MPIEPQTKRLYAFVDGQALYRSAKNAFGYTYPNYDPLALSNKIALANGWTLAKVYFYTGIPDVSDNAFWHDFWVAKLGVMGTRGISTFSRPLRYRNQKIKLRDGSEHTILVGQEKGIDVRIALDIVRLARENLYDVGLIFSQDQDLSEAADEVRKISVEQGRWIKIASTFPVSPTCQNKRGINNTHWLKIDRVMYDTCIDSVDYRRKPPLNTVLP